MPEEAYLECLLWGLRRRTPPARWKWAKEGVCFRGLVELTVKGFVRHMSINISRLPMHLQGWMDELWGWWVVKFGRYLGNRLRSAGQAFACYVIQQQQHLLPGFLDGRVFSHWWGGRVGASTQVRQLGGCFTCSRSKSLSHTHTSPTAALIQYITTSSFPPRDSLDAD